MAPDKRKKVRTTPAPRSEKVARPPTRARKAAAASPQPARTAVLVLGMHRSGTSALARVLSLLGCDLPQTLMGAGAANEASHWESMAVYKVNDRILESAGSAWHDWLELNPGWFDSPKAEEFREEAVGVMNKEFGASRLFVFKDARSCRLLPFWLDVFRQCDVRPVALLPVRNPLEVAASLEKRDGFEPALGQLLWLRHVLEAEAASRDILRIFCTYDQLMQSWGRVAKQAQATLGVNWPRLSDRSAEEIDAFLLEDHRHHRKPPESVIDNPALSQWLRETFAIMEGWARTGERQAERAALDRIRREFNAAAPAFARLVASGEAARRKVVTLETSLSAETGKLSAAQASAIEAEKKAAQIRQELEAARTRAADGEKKATELQAELAKRASALHAAEAARAEAAAKAGATEVAAAQQREKAAALEKELAAARQQAAEAGKRATELQAEVQKRTAAADAAEAAHAEAQAKIGAVEAAAVQQREKTAALEKELADARQQAVEAGKRATELQAEVEKQSSAATAAGAARAEAAEKAAAAEAALAAERDRAAALQAELAAAAARLEEEASARDEVRRLADEAGARSAEGQAIVSELRAELARREEEIRALEQVRADTEWRRGELVAWHAEQKERAAQLNEELTAVRESLAEEQRGAERLKADLAERAAQLNEELTAVRESLAEEQRGAERLKAELAERADVAEEAERAASDLRHRLAVTESALAQRSHESEQTAAELAAARRELEQVVAQRQEVEKVVGGLREHVTLLLSSVKERQAAFVALEAAHAEQTRRVDALQRDAAELVTLRVELKQAEAEAGKARAAMEAEIAKLRSDLSEAGAAAESQRAKAESEMKALKAEAEKLRAEKTAAERKAASEQARVEQRLEERFDEIAGLTRMVAEAEQKAGHKDEAIEAMRAALAKEMGRTVSALLDGRALRFMPMRLRLRRQMALLRRSGLFDAEWYKSHYQDIADAGVDPLLHYVVHGAREGREPNRTLAELKSAAAAEH